MAGDGEWSTPSSRPPSAVRRGLRLWLLEQQQGRCVLCGCDNPSRFTKLVPANNGRGWIAGNVVLACKAIANIQYTDIAHPELIPNYWPNNFTLKGLQE